MKTAPKVGFDGIITLHAEILPSDNIEMIGTDFCLYGCTKEDIASCRAGGLVFEIIRGVCYG